MVAPKQSTVTNRRALLTDREREIIAGEADVEDSYRYQTISRVRSRFDRLAEDIAALEAHGDLADELRDIVCQPSAGVDGESKEGRDAADTLPSAEGTVTHGDRDNRGEAASARRETETSGEASSQPRVRDDPSPMTGGVSPADVEDDTDGDLAADVRQYLEANDVPPKTSHGRDAVIDVFRQLREHGTMKTGELQEAVYPNYESQWTDGRGMWNAIDRHLDGIPGIVKGGYGEWDYAGDNAVRSELGGGDQ